MILLSLVLMLVTMMPASWAVITIRPLVRMNIYDIVSSI
jgi:hypothetical protein